VVFVVIILPFLLYWVLRKKQRYCRNSSHKDVVDAADVLSFSRAMFETEHDKQLEEGYSGVGVFSEAAVASGISRSFPFERLHFTRVILGECAVGHMARDRWTFIIIGRNHTLQACECGLTSIV